jgi:hypothetical protein
MEEILANAASRGLDGVCITDHDTMDAGLAIKEGFHDGLLVIIGMEYATPQGDFLLFGPLEDLSPGLAARDMLGLVREAGGVAVAAHPCRLLRPADEVLAAKGLVDCLEVVNGRNRPREDRCAQDWATRYGLTPVSGSDAHCLAELGCAPTRFLDPVASRADLVAVLKNGRCAPASLTASDNAHGHNPLTSQGLALL